MNVVPAGNRQLAYTFVPGIHQGLGDTIVKVATSGMHENDYTLKQENAALTAEIGRLNAIISNQLNSGSGGPSSVVSGVNATIVSAREDELKKKLKEKMNALKRVKEKLNEIEIERNQLLFHLEDNKMNLMTQMGRDEKDSFFKAMSLDDLLRAAAMKAKDNDNDCMRFFDITRNMIAGISMGTIGRKEDRTDDLKRRESQIMDMLAVINTQFKMYNKSKYLEQITALMRDAFDLLHGEVKGILDMYKKSPDEQITINQNVSVRLDKKLIGIYFGFCAPTFLHDFIKCVSTTASRRPDFMPDSYVLDNITHRVTDLYPMYYMQKDSMGSLYKIPKPPNTNPGPLYTATKPMRVMGIAPDMPVLFAQFAAYFGYFLYKPMAKNMPDDTFSRSVDKEMGYCLFSEFEIFVHMAMLQHYGNNEQQYFNEFVKKMGNFVNPRKKENTTLLKAMWQLYSNVEKQRSANKDARFKCNDRYVMYTKITRGESKVVPQGVSLLNLMAASTTAGSASTTPAGATAGTSTATTTAANTINTAPTTNNIFVPYQFPAPDTLFKTTPTIFSEATDIPREYAKSISVLLGGGEMMVGSNMMKNISRKLRSYDEFDIVDDEENGGVYDDAGARDDLLSDSFVWRDTTLGKIANLSTEAINDARRLKREIKAEDTGVKPGNQLTVSDVMQLSTLNREEYLTKMPYMHRLWAMIVMFYNCVKFITQLKTSSKKAIDAAVGNQEIMDTLGTLVMELMQYNPDKNHVYFKSVHSEYPGLMMLYTFGFGNDGQKFDINNDYLCSEDCFQHRPHRKRYLDAFSKYFRWIKELDKPAEMIGKTVQTQSASFSRRIPGVYGVSFPDGKKRETSHITIPVVDSDDNLAKIACVRWMETNSNEKNTDRYIDTNHENLWGVNINFLNDDNGIKYSTLASKSVFQYFNSSPLVNIEMRSSHYLSSNPAGNARSRVYSKDGSVLKFIQFPITFDAEVYKCIQSNGSVNITVRTGSGTKTINHRIRDQYSFPANI